MIQGPISRRTAPSGRACPGPSGAPQAAHRDPATATALLCALACAGADAQEPEFAWFRVTGVEGYVGARYVSDAVDTDTVLSGTTLKSRQRQTDLRSEVFLLTHSYVYHPNLLSLDVGAGPVFERAGSALDAVDTRSRATLYNLTARATILREKPYRGSVYYEHLNPTLSVSPGQVLNQEFDRYGLDAALVGPEMPVPLRFEATRTKQRGRGLDRILDDRLDQATLRGERGYGSLGQTQFTYQRTRQESLDGSPTVPIQRSVSNGQDLTVDTRLTWDQQRYEFANLLTYNRLAYSVAPFPVPISSQTRAFVSLQARPTKALQGTATLDYGESTQGELATRTRSADARLSYELARETVAGLGMHASTSDATELAVSSRTADASLRSLVRTARGDLAATYSVRFEQRSQNAASTQAAVLGERVLLSTTAPVALARPRVIAGSVIVTNDTRTQTFAEGLDYLLTVVGTETRVQRLVGGNIFDGQNVRIDYLIDTGGTYGNTRLDQSLNLSWTVPRYGSVYLRHLASVPRLTSGAPTVRLNAIHSTLIGARADIALEYGLLQVVGGYVEREDRRETIAPYLRNAYEVFVQTELPWTPYGAMRLSKRRSRVVSEAERGDSDVDGYDASLWWRPTYGFDLSFTAAREQERAGPVPRTRTLGTLKGTWRVRQLTTTLDLSRVRDRQLGQTRTRTFGQLQVRREF